MVAAKDAKMQNLHAKSTSISRTMSPFNEKEGALTCHNAPFHSGGTSPIGFSGPLLMNKKTEKSFGPKLGKQYSRTPTMAHEELVNAKLQYHSHVMKNEILIKSGPLGMCNKTDCVQCPGAYRAKQEGNKEKKVQVENKLYKILYGDSKGWARKVVASLNSNLPIMNPQTKIVQQWNKFFVISCLVAIFTDPLFFFLLNVDRGNKCIVLNWSLATTILVVRSLTDFMYFLHMLLQFRLAYVAPESRVVGAGDLVDDPKKVALNYLQGYFILDLFVLLPLRQVMILVAIPRSLVSSAANYVKNVLRATVLLQYVPRIIRIIPLLGGQSATGFIFESAWSNFVINLLMFFLAGHVVGSCWYLFGLQRVNQCLCDACSQSNISSCKSFIDCGKGDAIERFKTIKSWNAWINDKASSSCFSTSGDFQYGIYEMAVLLSTDYRMFRRYIYALFWGFQDHSERSVTWFAWQFLNIWPWK